MATLPIKVTTSGISQASREIKQLDGQLVKGSKSASAMGSNMGSLATKVVGAVAVFKAFEAITSKVIANGINYNKTMENQLQGLTSLTVATSKNIDSMGKALTLQDKYTLAQKESLGTLRELTALNAQTPQTLEQTVKVYKSLLPSFKQVGASQKEMLDITKSLAVASASAGIEFNSLLAGVDGLATGTVLSNSDLGRFLNTIGLTNEKLKDSNDVVGLVTSSLKDFNVEIDTMDTATSNLENAWNELTGTLTGVIFDNVKDSVKDLADYLNIANVALVNFFNSFRDASNLSSVDALNKRVLDVYSEIENKTKDLSETSFFETIFGKGGDGKTRAELRALKVELLSAVSEYDKFTESSASLVAKIGGSNPISDKKSKSKKTSKTKKEEIATTSLADWKEYYETIGDYSTAWALKEASLKARYVDATEEQFKKMASIAKTEYYDEIEKRNEKLKKTFEFDISLDGLDSSTTSLLKTMENLTEAQKEFNKYTKENGKDSEGYDEAKEKHQDNMVKGYSNLSGAIASMFSQGSKEAEAFTRIQAGIAMISGVTAVLEQAKGDPYSSFARMAKMAGTVAGLLGNANIAFGGIGGSSTSTTSDYYSSLEANTGTGTILGDSKAQSESITNAMEVLEDFAEPQFETLESMNYYLKNISDNIGGVSSLLLQQGGFAFGEGVSGYDTGYGNRFTAKDLGLGGAVSVLNTMTGGLSLFGDVINSVLGGLFGKTSVSQSLTDSGIFFADTLLTSAIEEFDGSSFQTISTTVKKKSWFSSSSSTSINTYFEDLDSETERQFSLVLDGLYQTTLLAGDALDQSSSETAKSLEDFIISIGKISLKDKTGDEIQEELTTIFGAIGDDIASTAFPLLTAFQAVGEGMFETLTRVATGMEESEYYINKLGIAFGDIAYTDILNTQGDVGFEALSQSIIRTDEALYGVDNNLVQLISSLDTTAEGLYETYTELDTLRDRLGFLGQDLNGLSRAMVVGAGGIDELQNGFESYFDNFLTDSEQLAFNTSQVRDEFNKLGIELPTSKQAFTELLNSLDLTNESGQEMYGRFISLSDVFNDITEAQDGYLDSIQSTIDALNELSGDTDSGRFEQLTRFNQLTADFATSQDSDTLDAILSLGTTLGNDSALTSSVISSLEKTSSNIGLTGEDNLASAYIEQPKTAEEIQAIAFNSEKSDFEERLSSAYNEQSKIVSSNFNLWEGGKTYEVVGKTSEQIIAIQNSNPAWYNKFSTDDKYLNSQITIEKLLEEKALKGYSKGGYTGIGGINDVAGIVHKGEYVVNQQQMASIGGVSGMESLLKNGNTELIKSIDDLVGYTKSILKDNMELTRIIKRVTLGGSVMQVELAK